MIRTTSSSESLDIETDELSHRDEHSLEVQMPFIKYRFPRARIAPVMMGQQDYASAMRLAEKISSCGPADKTGRPDRCIQRLFALCACSKRQNRMTSGRSNRLATLDTKEFYRRIAERRVTACGYGPITAMVNACSGLGAKAAKLIRYATSGDVTGDNKEVVGYASIAVI